MKHKKLFWVGIGLIVFGLLGTIAIATNKTADKGAITIGVLFVAIGAFLVTKNKNKIPAQAKPVPPVKTKRPAKAQAPQQGQDYMSTAEYYGVDEPVEPSDGRILWDQEFTEHDENNRATVYVPEPQKLIDIFGRNSTVIGYAELAAEPDNAVASDAVALWVQGKPLAYLTEARLAYATGKLARKRVNHLYLPVLIKTEENKIQTDSITVVNQEARMWVFSRKKDWIGFSAWLARKTKTKLKTI